MTSPYDVLVVDPGADLEEIEAAYRERVKQAHPDQGGSAEQFQRVTEAYEQILAEYDDPTTGAAGHAPVDGVDTTPSSTSDDREEDEPDPRVEYLDYEVVADRGWDVNGDDLFEKAASADIDGDRWGQISVSREASLLESAEGCGFTWPYSCRGGACANCAVAVLEGDLEMPANHVLTDELLDQGIRLSCIGRPASEKLRVVYNVKHLPALDDLLLPPGPFDGASDD